MHQSVPSGSCPNGPKIGTTRCFPVLFPGPRGHLRPGGRPTAFWSFPKRPCALNPLHHAHRFDPPGARHAPARDGSLRDRQHSDRTGRTAGAARGRPAALLYADDASGVTGCGGPCGRSERAVARVRGGALLRRCAFVPVVLCPFSAPWEGDGTAGRPPAPREPLSGPIGARVSRRR